MRTGFHTSLHLELVVEQLKLGCLGTCEHWTLPIDIAYEHKTTISGAVHMRTGSHTTMHFQLMGWYNRTTWVVGYAMPETMPLQSVVM